MRRFFSRNIGTRGRRARAVMGLIFFATGVLIYGPESWRKWTAGGLALSGAFAFIEAARGWCFLRACGVRTKW